MTNGLANLVEFRKPGQATIRNAWASSMKASALLSDESL